MKKQLLLFVMMLLPMVASADAVEIDGIYYNLINKTKTAEVVNGDKIYSENIVIPEVVEYENVTYSVKSISDGAFKSSSIESIIIGNNIETIEYGAFENCYSLSHVTFGTKVKTIGGRAFSWCSGLTELEIPSNVEAIFSNAFADCRNLKTLVLNNGLKSIYPTSFVRCIKLVSIKIPGSVSVVEKEAFEHCTELQEVILEEGVKELKMNCFGYCTKLTTLYIPKSINNDLNLPFTGCTNLTEVHIPELSICYNIGIGLSNSQYNLYINNEEVVEAQIPEGVLSIADNAFAGCKSIKKVIIPNSVSYLGYNAFLNCSNLSSVNIPNSISKLSFSTFYGCANLTKVEIPENIKVIGNMAFGNCKELIDVYCYSKSIPSTSENAFDGSDINYSTLHVPYGMSEIYKNEKPWSLFGTIVELPQTVYNLIYTVDGKEYKCYEVEYGAAITPEAEPTKEGYTFSGWSEIPETMPAHDVTVTGTFSINSYKLTYVVDGQTYKTYDVEYGATITPEAEPAKDGYTFSGWSEIPETMPAHDVTVTGTFSINKYKLTYTVDGAEYKTYEVEYGATITPEAEPTKEGYTFSGWSEIPETMPAHDVTVTGSFTKGAYKLTYYVDGVVYKTVSYDYGATITPEAEPTKEGYTFSGWSEIPETMPAHDVTVTGTFSINKYKLTYTVDGEEYKSYEIEYGATITPKTEPIKEGYTFSGWSEIPETMPAHDVTVTGTFTINKYKLTYIVDGAEYKTHEIEYNATIIAEEEPTKEGYTFSGWSEIPSTMPPYDVTVTGTFNINSYKLTYMIDDKVYKEMMYEYGATIIPEPQPEEDYDTFEWIDLPQTMPAHDVVVYASYTSGIIEVLMTSRQNVRIYSANGKKLNKLQKGINIVILNDGTVKKIVTK